jgi:hypothetical protein
LTLQPGIHSKTVRLYWNNHNKVKVANVPLLHHCAVLTPPCRLLIDFRPVQIDGKFGIEVDEFVELGKRRCSVNSRRKAVLLTVSPQVLF